MKTKIILLLLFVTGISHGQNDDLLAKSYFLQAQQAYGNSQNTKAIEYLDKCVESIGGITNAKIEALYVNICVKKRDMMKAEKHIVSYFEKADEDHSDYMEMLSIFSDVKEKSEAIKKVQLEEFQVQKSLNNGTPILEILATYDVKMLYGKEYLGGLIIDINLLDGSGLVVSKKPYEKKMTWFDAMKMFPQSGTWRIPSKGEVDILHNWDVQIKIKRDNYPDFTYWTHTIGSIYESNNNDIARIFYIFPTNVFAQRKNKYNHILLFRSF